MGGERGGKERIRKGPIHILGIGLQLACIFCFTSVSNPCLGLVCLSLSFKSKFLITEIN